MKMPLRVLVSALALVAAGRVSADVIYRETFATAANVGQQSPGDWGWTVQSTTALSQAATISGGATAGVAGTGGYASNPDDVNSNSRVGQTVGTGAASLGYGFMGWQMNLGGQGVFTSTGEYTIDRDLYDVTSLRIDASGYPAGAAADDIRVAVQIGGDWYASAHAAAPALQSASGGTLFATQYGALTYDFSTAASDWRTLTISGSGSSSGFLLGPDPLLTDLPTGDITAFGVYWDMATLSGGTSYPRWDNFTVNGVVVPEPAGSVLFLLASALLLRRRDRRTE
jgi:hypothetical protein